MTVSYRSGRETDVPVAADLFVEALVDLCRRNGLPLAAPPSAASWVSVYEHIHATGVLEIAEDGGEMVAFASGIVRGDQFFLSMFWTRPTRQRSGIGRPLLERVWAEAARRGARVHHVWSSIDYPAIGTYLRFGMRPVGPILTFGGAPRALPACEADLSPLTIEAAGRIDHEVRGTARPEDHAFFSREKQRAHLVSREGAPLGYFYAHEGRVGPVAWTRDADGTTVLRAAIATAARDAESVAFAAPGPNRTAIDLAVELGLPIQGTSHYMSSTPIGAIERYVPSGPALF